MIACDGRVVWFRTSVRLVDVNEKKELVGVMTDITERRRAQDDAENAGRAKSAFLAEIERLNGPRKRENSRMSTELEVSQRLQQMMLPRDPGSARTSPTSTFPVPWRRRRRSAATF